MRLPDVTEILNDPEVGGGVAFTVRRTTNVRKKGTVTQTTEDITVTGNIQPQDKSTQTSTSEDQYTENIVIYAPFEFRLGKNEGGKSFIGTDAVLYDGKTYRVTKVNNWSAWGFSIAYATRVMDYIAPAETPAVLPVEEPGEEEGD